MDGKVNAPDADEPRDLAEIDELDIADPLEDFRDDLFDDLEDDGDLWDDADEDDYEDEDE